MSNDFAPEYVDVAERLRLLFEKYPDASLRGSYEILTVGDSTFIAYRAECFRSEMDDAPGVGTAWEQIPGKTPFTRGSELQNAETSAWGRAIVAVGAAASKHVASADEVRNRAPMPPPDGFASHDEARARTSEVSALAKRSDIGEWVKDQGFEWPWSARACGAIAAKALEVSAEAEGATRNGAAGAPPDVRPPAAPSSDRPIIPEPPRISPQRLKKASARVVALSADKVPVAARREAAGLPPLDGRLSEAHMDGWEALLDVLEGELEAPFVEAS